jgi:hypothetical protein
MTIESIDGELLSHKDPRKEPMHHAEKAKELRKQREAEQAEQERIKELDNEYWTLRDLIKLTKSGSLTFSKTRVKWVNERIEELEKILNI